ncbi:MAG: PQQ-binding-like beta-propeller repeat protein [Planctomycetota bacterium]|nr:PQQ-binding-like beta-propeller repeat protein [Planctomycetota bacterium]
MGLSKKHRAVAGFLALCLVVPVSCSLRSPAPPETLTGAQEAVSRARSSTAPRIPEEVLSNAGLEEIWYSPSSSVHDRRDAGVHTAYLLDEGIVLVTRSRKPEGDRLIKLLKRADGLPVWWEAIEGPVVEAPFVFTYPAGIAKDPEMFFRVHDTIHCVDFRHGSHLWKKQVEPPIASRIVADDTHVFFGSENNRLYGYRKGAAFDDWSYGTGGRSPTAPVINSSRVVFGSFDGGIYGMVPDQGWVSFRSWKRATGGAIVGGIASYSRWVFVGSTDYKLYCLEGSDGSVYWSFVAGAPIREAPVVFRHRANQEYVYCISTEGNRRPRRTLFAVPIPKGRAPRGVALWRKEGVRQVVTIGRDTLYVLADDRDRSLIGLDVKTGEEKFRISLAGFNFVPTNHADSGRNSRERGRIYLISRAGAIQCIGES